MIADTPSSVKHYITVLLFVPHNSVDDFAIRGSFIASQWMIFQVGAKILVCQCDITQDISLYVYTLLITCNENAKKQLDILPLIAKSSTRIFDICI
jgi:hypothetical protein